MKPLGPQCVEERGRFGPADAGDPLEPGDGGGDMTDLVMENDIDRRRAVGIAMAAEAFGKAGSGVEAARLENEVANGETGRRAIGGLRG